MKLQRLRRIGLATVAALAAAPAYATDIVVSDASVPPNGDVGSNSVLSMTVTNGGADADALVRAACPFANFSEKRTVDRGEGAPSAREIRNIPVPAHTTLRLGPHGYHVLLLQTREKLMAGGGYECSLSFRKAGPMRIQVKVAPAT